MDSEIAASEKTPNLNKSDDRNKDAAALHVVPLKSILIFILGTVLTAVLIELLPVGGGFWNALKLYETLDSSSAQTHRRNAFTAPKYAIYGKSPDEDHLIHVISVLEKLGWVRTNFDGDWDLLWAHDYPYLSMPQRMKNLKSHQIVNHLPGCGFITNKVDLSTSNLPFLPHAFRLPSQKDSFLEFAKEYPNVLFVEKHNEHRYIAIKKPSEINLDSNDSFVQEFVQQPFLVDGYKFDIGVYVVITSVNPLRAYIYTGDVLFRYCPVKYYPFDANNVDKYVVGDDYLPTWLVPSLKKYYNRFGGSMRGVFDAYVRDQNMDPSGIWLQVEDIVRQTVLAKEPDIVRIMRAYKTRNFFELLRFDLIIDEKLRVHLMEANMSPNLSSAHFKPNSLLYEQILYSVLNLVGVGTPVRRSFENHDELDEMITAEKNLGTNLNGCVENDCDVSCNNPECDLCLPCLQGSEYRVLEEAHREHLHKIDMKRIFPKPILNLRSFDVNTELRNLTGRNAWLTRWFYEKCQYDSSWCQ